MVVAGLLWTAPTHVLLRLVCFVLALHAQAFNTVPSIQSVPDLLVCLHEPLKFHIQVPVLSLQNVAVVVQSVNLSPDVVVSRLHGLVREPQIVQFSPCHCEGLLSVTRLSIEVMHICGQIPVATHFLIVPPRQVILFSKFHVKSPGEVLLLIMETSLFISALQQVKVCCFICFTGAA